MMRSLLLFHSDPGVATAARIDDFWLCRNALYPFCSHNLSGYSSGDLLVKILPPPLRTQCTSFVLIRNRILSKPLKIVPNHAYAVELMEIFTSPNI
jgi:hypothetical protein